jgi:hypothetical protein
MAMAEWLTTEPASKLSGHDPELDDLICDGSEEAGQKGETTLRDSQEYLRSVQRQNG